MGGGGGGGGGGEGKDEMNLKSPSPPFYKMLGSRTTTRQFRYNSEICT